MADDRGAPAAVVGKTVGYWLSAADFVATDGSGLEGLGALGFLRDWPAVYTENKALKSLVGKKGSCAAKRVAVVGPPSREELERVAGSALQPLQSFANAELVEKAAGMPVVQGWAIFERLDQPPGTVFVGERFWWNALPEGGWVDFTPRPAAWPQLLLAEAAAGAPKARSRLTAPGAELAAQLLRSRFPGVGASFGSVAASEPEVEEASALDRELAPLREELARASREADQACSELRRLEGQVSELRQKLNLCPLHAERWTIPTTGDDLKLGSLVAVHGLKEAADLNGQEAVLESWEERRGRWKVRLATGELHTVLAANLKLLDEAREEPELSTFGCEVVGTLTSQAGDLQYNLWPLVHSGIIRVRLPDRLLARLNVQFDALHANHDTPSHALFLQAEIKEGKQLTVREPDEEYVAMLLACAEKLGAAILGQEEAAAFRCTLDQVWTVHQLAGDYNPVHFHSNARSHFGFSSFLHLQLPPQLNSGQEMLPHTGARGRHDGVTTFMWKGDSGTVAERLECSGLLECELAEGYLYVFPQWLQHLVWPFKGPGERRSVAANVALFGAAEGERDRRRAGPERGFDAGGRPWPARRSSPRNTAADLSDPRRAARASSWQ